MFLVILMPLSSVCVCLKMCVKCLCINKMSCYYARVPDFVGWVDFLQFYRNVSIVVKKKKKKNQTTVAVLYWKLLRVPIFTG